MSDLSYVPDPGYSLIQDGQLLTISSRKRGILNMHILAGEIKQQELDDARFARWEE